MDGATITDTVLLIKCFVLYRLISIKERWGQETVSQEGTPLFLGVAAHIPHQFSIDR
jgi:hypothetical protein